MKCEICGKEISDHICDQCWRALEDQNNQSALAFHSACVSGNVEAYYTEPQYDEAYGEDGKPIVESQD